jgi:hypothetical protein
VNTPARTDPRWAEWAKPVAALLRAGPRPAPECLRLCAVRRATPVHAQNVLAWLDLEGFVRRHAGLVVLSPAGRAWLGDFKAELTSVPVVARRREARAVDLRPFTYGRLHPLERAGRNGFGDAMWLCACECGETRIVSARNLRTGNTRSCGCLRVALWASGLRPSAWRAA